MRSFVYNDAMYGGTKMKFKIISDSSSDLTKDYLQTEYGNTDIGCEVVPFTVTVNNREFVDDGTFSNEELYEAMVEKSKTFSSCPSPLQFEEKCDAEYNFIVTISAKLSGSYNSAAILMDSPDKNVFVIDSKGTAGNEHLIVDELYKLITAGKSYEEIKEEIIKYRDSLILYFTLSCFDNLVDKGRIKAGLAKFIQLIRIKLLCKADDGEISLFKKCLSFNQSLRAMCAEIKSKGVKREKCVITYTNNIEDAISMKEKLQKIEIFDNIVIVKANILNSFYALKKGLIVCY